MPQITACKDCVDCKYYERLDKFYMLCHARDKKYHYGGWIPCNDKEEGFFVKEDYEPTDEKKGY